MSTFQNARANGAGTILAGKAGRFKVSDWSPSDRTTYGRRVNERGEPVGRYQKLPEGLAREGSDQ